jgi:enoyl-CoA hydratase/carnithine racemase
MLGQPFGATLAAEIGLVTEVVPDARVLDTAIETASKLAAKPPAALQACKRLIKRYPRKQLDEAIKIENEEFASRVRSAEAKEAFTAFIEKRRPDFTKAQRA